MSVNQRRRQKKLERLAAKRKDRHTALRRVKHRGLAERLADAAAAPVLHCWVSSTRTAEGMRTVLLSRQLSGGNIAFAVFLVDLWCLGVKNAMGNVLSKGEYNAFLSRFRDRMEMVTTAPEDARKLVEGAVQYARDLGLEPHADYHRTKPIFGDIDTSQATREFTFGQDGKPHFFAGPHDSPERCRQIIAILQQRCGPDGFHYTIPVTRVPEEWLEGGKVVAFEEDEEADEEWDDEEDADERPLRGLGGW